MIQGRAGQARKSALGSNLKSTLSHSNGAASPPAKPGGQGGDTKISMRPLPRRGYDRGQSYLSALCTH